MRPPPQYSGREVRQNNPGGLEVSPVGMLGGVHIQLLKKKTDFSEVNNKPPDYCY